MKKSHKIAIAIGVLLMIIISIFGANLVKLKADEFVQTGVYDTFHIEVYNDYSDEIVEQYTFDLSLPAGQYPLFYAYDYQSSGVVTTYHSVMLFILDTSTGIIKCAPDIDYRYIRYNGKDIQDINRKGQIQVSSRLEYPYVVGAPAYRYDGLVADIYKDKQDEAILSGEKLPVSGSALWDKSNHYDKRSVYAPKNVIAPDVFYAQLEYKKGAWKGDDDYEFQIKYRVGKMGEYDLTDYYTEIWVEIPVHDIVTGATTSRKVYIGSYRTNDLFVRDIYTVSRPAPDGSEEIVETGEKIDKGYHYEINDKWNRTFGRYIDSAYASTYGGITVYVRNAVYNGDSALVSDFCYFDFKPTNSYETENGVTVDVPTNIYKHTGDSIDENSGNDKQPDKDTAGENNDNSTLAGSGTNGNGKPSGGGVYVPSGKWTVSDFAEWTQNGFGLLGSNGIIALVGSLFVWLPADIFNLIFWSVLCGVIIAVIKLVF